MYSTGSDISVRSNSTAWIAGVGLCFALIALAIYQPAIHGSALWDDDKHLTPTYMRDLHGLSGIWSDPRTTQQYYPLLHSAFWLQARIWPEGDLTGYHTVNILLHAINALLIWRIARRLAGDRAGLLAAAIFLCHPVMVESVAWITELKNTLSTCFYLASILTYLRWRADPSHWGGRFTALLFFTLALLCKTVTATLPGALLVIAWWQEGRLTWKSIKPTLPMWALAIPAGIVTAWVELTIIGAHGEDFSLSFGHRILIGGRAIWFYLGKLLWPVDLSFIYRRWILNAQDLRQWAPVLAAVIALAAMIALATVKNSSPLRRRVPLAAGLFFIGTLLPVLGLFNVYPFKFSFVADHFQYLAAIGLIVAISAMLARLPRAAYLAILVALPALLGRMSWAQSRYYKDAQTLYAQALDHNPDCFLAHNNLGMIYASQGRLDQAIDCFKTAIRLKPNESEYHNNLGSALISMNQPDLEEVARHYRRAIELRPGYAAAHNNLGAVLSRKGDWSGAVALYQRAIQLEPTYAEPYVNLSKVLIQNQQRQQARQLLDIARRLQPDRRDLAGYYQILDAAPVTAADPVSPVRQQ